MSEDEEILAHQARVWIPILRRIEQQFGTNLHHTTGIARLAQPKEFIGEYADLLHSLSPFALAGRLTLDLYYLNRRYGVHDQVNKVGPAFHRLSAEPPEPGSAPGGGHP